MGNEIDKFHCRKSARLFHKHCGFAAIFGKGYMANKICIDNNSVKKILGISTEENCGLATYLRLQDKIRSGNFDEEFQKTWCRFYGVTSRSANWKKDFFAVFSECKKEKNLTLETVLRKLNGRENTGKFFELSFATKMLAGLNDSKPIIDKFVKRYFSLNLMNRGSFVERLPNALKQYAELEERYKDFFETDEAKTVLHFFDSKFPIYAPSISSVKKIDFLIYWKGKFVIN